MASFLGLFMAVALNMMMASVASPSSSLPFHKLKLETSISAAPALLPTIPLSPISTKLSPDISPLLPSSGGVVPSTSYSIPTIPSNPTQKPNGMPVFGPDSAIPPSGPVPDSSAVSLTSLNFSVFMGLLASWSLLSFAI